MVSKNGGSPSRAKTRETCTHSVENTDRGGGPVSSSGILLTSSRKGKRVIECTSAAPSRVVADGPRAKKQRRYSAGSLPPFEGDPANPKPPRGQPGQQRGHETQELGSLRGRHSGMKSEGTGCDEEVDSAHHPTAAEATSHDECKSTGNHSLWGGRRCVLLFTFCPLLLVRHRAEKSKNPGKRCPRSHQSRSVLLTADEHSPFLNSLGSESGRRLLGKGNNPLQPVVRKVQMHVRDIASNILGTTKRPDGDSKDSLNGLGTSLMPACNGLVRDASVPSRMRECVLTLAKKLLISSAENHWIAATCMRPDIVHQCLLSALDSPIIKQMRSLQQRNQRSSMTAHRFPIVDILLHTLDGKLIRVNCNFRVPRTFRVFKKVAQMLLSSSTGKLEVPNQGHSENASTDEEPLIEVLQPPLWRHFPPRSRWVALSEARDAPAVALRRFVEGIPDAVDASYTDDCAVSNKMSQTTLVEKGCQEAPAAVFVLSATQAIDSALVPRCLMPPAGDAGGCHPWHSVTAIRTSSYSVPAALRCDRLLVELSRNKWKQGNVLRSSATDSETKQFGPNV